MVWKDGVVSKTHPGMPLGWSLDGSVIVLTSGDPTGGTAGSGQRVDVRILTYPGFTDATRLSGIRFDPNYPPVFSADGSMVAFPCGANGTDPCSQVVVELDTGHAHEVAHQARGLPISWLPNRHLLLAHLDSPIVGPLEEWDGSKVVPSDLPPASWATASSTGAVALVTQAADESHQTEVMDADGKLLANLAGIAVLWSPDGSKLVVEADDNQSFAIVSIP